MILFPQTDDKSKFAKKWFGPYEVIKKFSPFGYKLRPVLEKLACKFLPLFLI